MSPSALGQWTKMRLRAETQIRDLVPDALLSKAPRKIVFFHVPKCGGTSVKKFIHACLGGKSSGQSCKVGEAVLDASNNREQIDKIRRARFVHGRCSWQNIELLQLAEEAFIFTFLREPMSRISSWHRFASRYPEERYNAATIERFQRSQGLNAREMFTSADPIVRGMVDNYMVRQFAGNLTDYPVNEQDWPQLLETAMENLQKVSFVGFHHNYASDFQRLAQQLNLPSLKTVPHENVTRPQYQASQANRQHSDRMDDETREAMQGLVYWDTKLYEFAHAQASR